MGRVQLNDEQTRCILPITDPQPVVDSTGEIVGYLTTTSEGRLRIFERLYAENPITEAEVERTRGRKPQTIDAFFDHIGVRR